MANKPDQNYYYIGLKLLGAFSVGCIGSGQMFLPIFYKKVLGLGNDKIGFIFSISMSNTLYIIHQISSFSQFSTFCIVYCLSLLDRFGR